MLDFRNFQIGSANIQINLNIKTLYVECRTGKNKYICNILIFGLIYFYLDLKKILGTSKIKYIIIIYIIQELTHPPAVPGKRV